MSVGRQFLFSLLVDDTIDPQRRIEMTLRQGVSEICFPADEDCKVWRFVADFFERYKRLPSLDVTEVETDIRFPEYAPEEPFDYWIDQLLLYNKHVFMADASERLVGLLNDGRTLQAADLVNDIYSGLIRFDPQMNAQTLADLAEEALVRPYRIQRGEIASGIPIGLPYIENVTGNTQPGDEWMIVGRPVYPLRGCLAFLQRINLSISWQ